MATAGSHGLSYKGAGKPAGLLCSSHTLEHRYEDEMARPDEKRQWRKLAKRREERIWKREAQEEMDDDQG